MVSGTRDVVVGDVHGCLEELEALLARLAPVAGDRFFFLGDLVDRGPSSVAVVRRVRDLLRAFPGSACIAGNHEEKALRFHEKGAEKASVLEDWARAADATDWAFLDALPLVHRVPEHGVILVHGGFFPRLFEEHGALGDIPSDWRRGRGKRLERLRRTLRIRTIDAAGNMVALGEETPSTVHWTARYDGREGFCFFGHDPQLEPSVPLRATHAMGLDTGCCFGGALTAAVLREGVPARDAEIVSVPGKRYADPLRARDEGSPTRSRAAP